MRKVIVGPLIALLVGVSAYFGVGFWAQQVAAREVDAVLDGWRTSVGSATRGRVAFDLWTRTLKIADIVVEAQTAARTRVTMAEVVAHGIDASGRASRVEIIDLDVNDAAPGQPGVRLEQKAPRVTLTGYLARPVAPRKVESVVDTWRFWLEQFSAITAASIDIPALTVAVRPAAGSSGSPAVGATEYTYTNIALRDVRNGRVADATVDGVTLRSSAGYPLGEITGEIGKTAIADVDVGPLVALLDPSRARDGDYQRVYRQLSVGPYMLRMGDGTSFSIDRIVAGDIGLHPAKLSLDDIIFLTEVAAPVGGMVSPDQMTMLIDKVAGLYDGLHLGTTEMLGLTVKAPRDELKIASVRMGRLESGRLAEFSMEGLDGRNALGNTFNMGRIAFKGLDITGLLRAVSAQLAVPRQPQGPPQDLGGLVGMLALIEGIDLKDIALPDPKTGREMRLQAFNASWGQFAGGVPSQAQLSTRLSIPISPADPEPLIRTLAGRGLDTVVAGVDVSARWSQATRALVLEPVTAEIGGLLVASLKASAGNVQLEILSTDAARAMEIAALMEAGPIEVSLRDLGIIDFAAAELARAGGAPPESGRTLLLEAFTRNAEALAQTNPGAQPLLKAVAQLLQRSGETLTIRLTPSGRVAFLELLTASGRDPASALARFSVEATVGR